MLWLCYFVKAQGFTIDKIIIFRGNLSFMLINRNGMAYSNKQIKHVMLRYYFIKYQIADGDIVVKHCPTREMLADNFTNFLQGALFCQFREEIQEIPATTYNGEWAGTYRGLSVYLPRRSIQPWKNPSHRSVMGKIVIMIFQ